MSFGVFAAVLAAALVHAGWNVLVKGAADKLAMTVSVALGAAIVSASILPFLPLPAPESWPFLGASVLLQSIYYLLIARAYRIADMSLAYPLMRGAAPLVVALSGAMVFGETLRTGQWMAIGLISAGIGALALGAFRQPLPEALRRYATPWSLPPTPWWTRAACAFPVRRWPTRCCWPC